MLDSVSVINSDRIALGPLVIPFMGAGELRLEFVDGLNPPPAILSLSAYANASGDHFQGSRVGTRNIVLTLGLYPSYVGGRDASAIRNELYEYLSPQNELTLVFNMGETQRIIKGFVETFETPLFAERSQVQVSIICPDPYFTGGWKSVSGVNLNGQLFSITNGGHVPVPMLLEIEPGVGEEDRPLTITVRAKETQVLAVSYRAWTSSTVNIKTQRGKKSFTSGGVSMLPYLLLGSKWLLLPPGASTVQVQFIGASTSRYCFLEFQERFVGI